MRRLTDGVRFVVSVLLTAIGEKIRYPAAALAYHAFVSSVPVLLLVFAILGRPYALEISAAIPHYLTPPVRELVDESIATASGRTGAGVLAVLVLVWSSANFVGDVRTVFARVEGDRPFAIRRVVSDGIAVIGSLVVGILAIVATSVVFAVRPTTPVLEVLAFVGLWVALAIAFVPFYTIPSAVVDGFEEALPGALVAALGWTMLHTAIRFYAVNAGRYALYGVLSGIIIVLTGLYIAASILFTGIVVNDQLAGRS